MGKIKIFFLVLIVVSPVLIWLLWPSDEARIRKLVSQTAQAAEANDVEGVMSAVDLTYRDSSGLSYLYLKKILERELGRLKNIDVSYSSLKVEVFKDDTAQAAMNLEVLAGEAEQRGYYLGGPGNDVVLTITLAKGQMGKWRVTHAEYDLGRQVPLE